MELPKDFCTMMRQQHGDEVAERLFEGLSAEASVSIRLNTNKICHTHPSPRENMAHVPWCPDAYYLDERPAFTFDPLFHAGAYYVQEASSMFLAEALRQHMPTDRPLVALDLCAAPGGKSTLLRSQMPDKSLLVSNEPMRPRAQVLAENITKWGHPNTVVTQNYPSDFVGFTDTFDLIVADVPCSGEGMFRKDEEAIREWSLENVDKCWHLQREIVETIWPCLKPGGLMIYSTCTFNRYEDEENVSWIASALGADILPVSLLPQWNVTEGTPGYHFYPGRTRGEGLYMAVLRKHGNVDETGQNEHDEALSAKVPTVKSKMRKHDKHGGKQTKDNTKTPAIVLPEGYTLKVDKDVCLAIPTLYDTLILRLRRMLHTLVAGVEVATLKGNDWVPSHALAMSTLLPRGTFPEYALTHAEAISYLRREALRIEAPRGYVLVTYRNLPLGFVKSIGNRANNMYPQEWRIRTTYTTEQPDVL